GEALALAERAGDTGTEAAVTQQLGTLLTLRGDYETAREWFDRAAVLHQSLGARRDHGRTLAALANNRLLRRDYAQAATCARCALEIARNVGDAATSATALAILGRVAARL